MVLARERRNTTKTGIFGEWRLPAPFSNAAPAPLSNLWIEKSGPITEAYSICIYIYIYAVELKIRPKIAFFWVENPSKISFFFLFFKNLLLSAGRMRFFKKNKRKKGKNKKNTIFCIENPSNCVAQHSWTDFRRNLGRIFNSTILLILGLFSFWKSAETAIFIVFSAKNEIFKPTPKN